MYSGNTPTTQCVIIYLALDIATYFTPKAHNSLGDMSAFQGIAYAWSTVPWFLDTLQVIGREPGG